MNNEAKQMAIIKQIVDKLAVNQKDELVVYIKGNDDGPIKHSDVEEYKRIISETQAEVAKLSKINKQQST